MQIFNIGPVELILILLIMFILLGPEGMLRTARQIGSWIRDLIRSPIWRDIMGYSREIRELPTKIVRDTGLEEDLEEIRKSTREATDELQKSVDDANKEVAQSLKETGDVKIKLDSNPPLGSKPLTSNAPAAAGKQAPSKAVEEAVEKKETTRPASDNGGSTIVANAPPTPLPPVQTFNKYSSGDEEEEDE
jgi:sec-independent protein translocase protein TatB